MAFTGSATIVQISDSMFRITGLSLAGAAVGTISLSGGTGDVKLPPTPQWNRYKNPKGVFVGFDATIDISAKPATAVATAVPVEVVKTGTGPTDFLATLTNNTGGTASPGLEIYVRFHT